MKPVRSRRTRGRRVKQAIDRIQQSGVRVLGLVLNDDRRPLQASVSRYAPTRTTEAPESGPVASLRR